MICLLAHAYRRALNGFPAALVLVMLSLAASTDGTSPTAQRSHVAQASHALQATPSANSCRDSFEDDGVPSQAKTIVMGETQSHTFCPAGDADWLVFFANKGKGYSIETSGLSAGVDTYLNLFAPDGRTLLATNDDAPGKHGPSRLLFYPQADGWYYIQGKNQGDIGYPGLQYSISLQQVQVDLPTSTPTPTQPIRPTPTATRSVSSSATSVPTPTRAAFTADLLHPENGDGEVDVFTAGPQDGMLPDGLEPDDSRESAKPISVGAIYKYLNFVLLSPATPDADFYSFRAKRGLCYRTQTGDLTAGIDTTLLLWQAVTTREKWRLIVQNDDTHTRTADLSSAVRWCASTDTNIIIEVRNYGGTVATDPRGKSYSLSLLIDPPTPTPSKAPAAQQQAQPSAPSYGGGSASGGVLQQQPQQPTRVVQAPVLVSTVMRFTPTPVPLVTTSVQASPTPTLTSTSIPTSQRVSVDVVAYIADASATGPNPGDGIVDLPVLLVDVRTNAVIQRATTDENGHAQLSWEWQGPVRVAMPAFRWGRTLQLQDFMHDGVTGVANGGTVRINDAPTTLLLQARMSSYPLPGIYP